MNPVREVQKKYCSKAMIFAIGVGSLFYLSGHPYPMKGLILGTLFSIINFILMGESLPHRLNKGRSKAIFAAMGSMVVRYIILAVPLILALKVEQYNLYATVVGMFMVQLMILFEHIGGNFTKIFKKQTGS